MECRQLWAGEVKEGLVSFTVSPSALLQALGSARLRSKIGRGLGTSGRERFKTQNHLHFICSYSLLQTLPRKAMQPVPIIYLPMYNIFTFKMKLLLPDKPQPWPKPLPFGISLIATPTASHPHDLQSRLNLLFVLLGTPGVEFTSELYPVCQMQMYLLGLLSQEL